ncbi:hypothetical protein DFS34DRAFT_305105 [Phlyctochytrium arcticum]|nr:hypothetical protein DFS34DRAFT_305105 [Phlyctochytrium arcticum]
MVSPTTPESPIDLRKRWRNGGPESSAGSIKGIASTLLKIGPASTSSSSTLIPACDKEIPHLPPELWLVIFRHLSPGSLAKSRCVARIWRDLSDEPALWKKFCLARGLDSELYVLKPVSSDTSGSPHVSDLSALETQDFLLAIGDWEAELELGMREHEDVITPTETESEPRYIYSLSTPAAF